MRSPTVGPASSRSPRTVFPHLASTATPEVGQLFADSIDRLYRAAIAIDETPRSQLAYACFLAEHGQYLESLYEFRDLLSSENLADDPHLLAEIVQRFSSIQTRMIEGGCV